MTYNPKCYTPTPGSLAARVCQFFRVHTEEELSSRDIALKFSVTAGSVHTELATAVANDALKRVKDDSGNTVYKAGPKLAETAAPDAPPRDPSAKPKRTIKPLPSIDVAAISVEENVPMPAAAHGRKSPDWAILFGKLPPNGASAPLPIAFRHSLKNAAEKYAKANAGIALTVRTVNENEVRVWRTA